MKIRWGNIIVVILLILALVIWLKAGPQIAELFSAMSDVGPYGDTTGRTFGLMAFGLICVTLVAIVKILVNDK